MHLALKDSSPKVDEQTGIGCLRRQGGYTPAVSGKSTPPWCEGVSLLSPAAASPTPGCLGNRAVPAGAGARAGIPGVQGGKIWRVTPPQPGDLGYRTGLARRRPYPRPQAGSRGDAVKAADPDRGPGIQLRAHGGAGVSGEQAKRE